MDGAIFCWQQDGRGTKPNRNSLTEIAVENANFFGKKCDMRTLLKYAKKCDNKRTTNDTIRDGILTCARKPI